MSAVGVAPIVASACNDPPKIYDPACFSLTQGSNQIFPPALRNH
jgi:hypothetical protein